MSTIISAKMTEILVIHRDLMIKGGAEAVCMNAIEALQENHSVTLVTTVKPDFEELNEYYHTTVSEENLSTDVFFPGHSFVSRLPVDIELLQWSIFHRYVRRLGRKFDIVINTTASDIAFPYKTIQYIHNPRPFDIHSQQATNIVQYVFYIFCQQISGFDKELFHNDTILTNSKWTNQRIFERYGCRSEILYPPITDSEFWNTPWEKRESGFLSIGRIEPSKNILQNIKTIRSLRDSGFDVHLHVIGPKGEKTYFEKVEQEASKDDFIILDGELSRESLVNMMCTHKFGIQGRMETFGIVIAEMVSAGVIPFVPDTGGQLDIINHNEDIMYSTDEELANKIKYLFGNPQKIDEVRCHISNGPDFSKNHFKYKLNRIINSNL